MGNRAVITTAPYKASNVGIYVHWNGGRDSVEGFLAAAKDLGYRGPVSDCYGMARLTGLICLYSGLANETSVGIDQCKKLDVTGDNGVYLIDDNWEIVGRKHYSRLEQSEHDSNDIRRRLVIAARTCDTACSALTD